MDFVKTLSKLIDVKMDIVTTVLKWGKTPLKHVSPPVVKIIKYVTSKHKFACKSK